MRNPEGFPILPLKLRGDIEEGPARMHASKEPTSGCTTIMERKTDPMNSFRQCHCHHVNEWTFENTTTLTLPHNLIRAAKLMYMTRVAFRHTSQTPPPNTKAA